MPNLLIINFNYGHVGSTHDATAWQDTCITQEHDTLLEPGEWIWADSAYLVKIPGSVINTVFTKYIDKLLDCCPVQEARSPSP